MEPFQQQQVKIEEVGMEPTEIVDLGGFLLVKGKKAIQ